MNRFLIVLFLVFVQLTYAQKDFYLLDSIDLSTYSDADKNLLDSCLSVYSGSSNDTIKIASVVALTEQLMHNDWVRYNVVLGDKVDELLKSNLSPREKRYYSEIRAGVANNNGVNAINTGEFDKAIKYLELSLVLDKELDRKQGIAYTLSNLGFVYENQGMIQKGLNSYSEALEILEAMHDSTGMMFTLNNIGYIYDIQKQYDMALQQYERTMEIAKLTNNKKLWSNSLNNIGSVYENLNRLEDGIVYCEKALAMRREIDDLEGVAQSLNNLGWQYEKLYEQNGNKGDSLLHKAIDNYNESLEIREKIKDYKLISYVYNSLASANFRLGNVEKALQYANKGMELGVEMKTPATQRNSAEALYEIYKSKGQFKESLQYYEQYITLRDSLINEENQKASIRQQTKYEFEKEQLMKEQAEKEAARIIEEETNRRNNIQYSLIFLGILVFFGVVLSLGFVKVSVTVAEGLIFFAFLIFFEFILVLTDSLIDGITQGEPIYKLLANALLAGLIFPAHAFFERALKRRILK